MALTKCKDCGQGHVCHVDIAIEETRMPNFDYETTYDKARKASEGAWATDRAAISTVALAILALVEELREHRRDV